MEELIGPNVQVVLTIKEARGFEQLSHPTSLIATLNGHSLETDLTTADLNSQYATDLVWEADKNSVRRMRSNHTPLKVECFAIKENGNKEKIGYLLLNIRTAQIVPRSKDICAKETWHQLLGLKKDLKIYKLSLLMSLTIEDRENTISSPTFKVTEFMEQLQTGEQNNMLTPCLLHDEHLIQLGPLKECYELFLLNVTAISAANLDLLLSSETNKHIKDNFTFCLNILDNDVQLKPFKKETENVWPLNEKIIIRIRSSLNVLKNYFQHKPQLSIYLYYEGNKVGRAKIDLRPLIPTDNIREYSKSASTTSKTLEERCFLIKEGTMGVSEIEQRKPYLDLQVRLQSVGVQINPPIHNSIKLMDTEKSAISSVSQCWDKHEINLERTVSNEIESHRNPSGDYKKSFSSSNGLQSYINTCHNVNAYGHDFAKAADELSNSCSVNPVPSSYDNHHSKNVEAYRCYCLHVTLNSIKLSSAKLAIRTIEFRFHHPKAEIMSTLCPQISISFGEKIKLQDVGCRLLFVSASDEIRNLLLMYPPKISIYDAEDVKRCISQSVLDVNPLFSQNKTECRYQLSLQSTEESNVGDLDVTLRLEDHGPYYTLKSRICGENLGPPILDDTLAYQIIDELETWKERQKEMFKAELKAKEERHLNLLSEEWQTRRESLESKLACSVEQCKLLASNLNNATEDLKTRRLKSLEKEARLIKANEDLQWRYEVKLQELRESTRAMQEDLTSKIKILEEKKASLESQVEPLRLENAELRLTVTKQAEELETYRKGSLTQDQTTSLLQELKVLEEKLNSAQKSKSFFKEQWAKSVREIHKMKMEHHQAIEAQIKTSKEELRNLDLEEILCADSTALSNDKILLGQLQKEIDVIKPTPIPTQRDHLNHIFTPINGVYSKSALSGKSVTKKSEEHDEKLRALIEERDSLLKTGSYNIDDTVIIKLNAEIRSLLING